MKSYKFISVILSVALLGTMFNFMVLAEETSVDGTTRPAYEQNFDDCTWWADSTTPTADEFTATLFYNGANNVDRVNELTSGMYGRADTDKSLHLGATFKHEYRKGNDGNNLAGNVDDWSIWPCDWGDPNIGNNGVSHKMSLTDNEARDGEKFWHVSFSAAQAPVPNGSIAGANGAGLDVSFVYKIDEGDGNSQDVEVLRWCDNNRRQTAFDTYYEVGVPDTAPMSAGRWINYDYVFNAEANTLDIYLNGYPVIKGKNIANNIQKDGTVVTPKGISKLNFQVRDINVEGERKVDVYVDDIKVTYSAAAPVISAKSVFGEKAKINAPEKYVNNETGVIYYYGQSLEDMKKYIHADGGDKKVYVVAKKWWNEANSWWTETTDSLNDFRMLQGDIAVNPVLCVEDGTFTYCYEVKQPLSTALNPLLTAADNTVTLSWEGQSENCQGIEIFKEGVKVAARGKETTSYTDAALTADTAHAYRIRELLPDNNVSVFAVPRFSDGTRVIYAEDFNKKTWWEEEETPTADVFARKPFFGYLNDNANMESTYTLETGANGRAANDKSLHISEKFKLKYGKKPDGENNVENSTEDGLWVASDWQNASGNNGVSHRMMSNSQLMSDDERYLHISFCAAQDPMPPETIGGEQGAGLDVSFDLMTANGNSEKEMLHWYSDRQHGVFGAFYQVRTDVGRWVNYDYVFDKTDNTMDIYVNGYPTVKGKDISGEKLNITGISRLNFQVRDINTGDTERDIHAYVDDIKVTYDVNEPVISPYSIFGESAKIEAPEKYIDSETGVIYNYGQSLSDMKRYIQGEGESTKNVYLVKEKADSAENWKLYEIYESESLDAVKLNDGRVVSPILYVENGSFTYRYQIVQTISYDAATKTALIKSEKDYDEAVVVIFAGYQDGVLMASNLQTATLRRGDNSVAADEGFDTSGVNEIRIMVWDSISSLRPLYGGWQLK